VAQELKLRCDIRASFATAFKNWRLRERIPLKKVAADLGLTVAAISMWESGKRFPTARHFEMLAEYTGLPPCRLFCVMADKCIPADCLLASPKKP
jgi:transcriptional regulator with XRE-family HTH domain